MIELKRVQPEDILKLWVMQKQSFQLDLQYNKDFSPATETLKKFIEKVNLYCFYSINHKNNLVGGICIKEYDKNNTWKISRIFISPSYQSKGLGCYTLKRMEEIHMDVNTWLLETPERNIRSQNFYEKNGFIKTDLICVTNALNTFYYKKVKS